MEGGHAEVGGRGGAGGGTSCPGRVEVRRAGQQDERRRQGWWI